MPSTYYDTPKAPKGELFGGLHHTTVATFVSTLRPFPQGVGMQIDDAGCYFDQAGELGALALQGRAG